MARPAAEIDDAPAGDAPCEIACCVAGETLIERRGVAALAHEQPQEVGPGPVGAAPSHGCGRYSAVVPTKALAGAKSTGRCGVAEWLLGAAAGVVVLGPAFRPGALLNLDLVVTSTSRVPPAVWGLGPDLPRRVPYGVPLAWLAQVFGGEITGKAVLAAAIAVAFVGATRLAGNAPRTASIGAGMLYALSPWLLTRIAVGHIGIVLTAALLPWALPTLLRPGDDTSRTILWCAGFGMCGTYGGVIAATCLVVGLAADKGRRAGRTVLIVVVTQLPWVIPALAIVGAAGPFAGPEHFRTTARGVTAPLQLAAGHGFWLSPNQSGGRGGAGVALLGALALGLAAFGHSRLPAWRGRALTVAIIGGAIALASATPGIDGIADAVGASTAGAPLREGQRAAVLALVWLAPAATLGAIRLVGTAGRPAGGLLALALAAPGLWGAQGALVPVRFPSSWPHARAAISKEPGTVLALPWHEYFDVSFAGGRRVLNPMPDYFGGDVIASSDPELGPPRHEGGDPRESIVDEVVAAIRRGEQPARALAAVGIRWIVVAHESDWRDLIGIAADQGLEQVVHDDALDLYRVRSWTGEIIDATGAVQRVRHRVGPLVQLASSASAGTLTWHRAGGRGWMRGTGAAHTTIEGGLSVPAGGRWLWYWPAAAVLIGDLCAAGLVAGAVTVSCRRGRVGAHRAPQGPRRREPRGR